GCTHGIAHRLLAEALDELGLRERTILVAPVGCSVLAYDYFDVDGCEAAHGRAPAMAVGLKRVQPNNIVVTYQGDGDLVSIGAAEIFHVAARGDNITTLFINNAIYGMTGGQMAPTTMPGQRASTAPTGRDTDQTGMPIKMANLLGALVTPAYVTRQAVLKPQQINKAKKAIKQAFQYQVEGKCFSFVEVVSTCPTNWGLTPLDSLKWAEDTLLPYYELGDVKTPE
ncbi:MAG: 2-oxoglutarate oxidoreductase, partial [Desulfobacteraceae bacterium]|nr:2-oxoglutarate oxidoreductase [Desulfobacteraceae bacterium]